MVEADPPGTVVDVVVEDVDVEVLDVEVDDVVLEVVVDDVDDVLLPHEWNLQFAFAVGAKLTTVARATAKVAIRARNRELL